MGDLLDRETALAAVWGAFDRARAGSGQVVVITGEPGIGKTALAQHVLAGLPPDVRSVEGACDDLLTPRPLSPFHDIARQAGGELAELLRDGAGRDRVHHALVELLSRLPPPPVVLLEDLHWADEATLDALTLLGRRVSERAILLLTTHRASEVGPGHPLTRVLAGLPSRHTTLLPLEPLSTAAVAHLAADHAVDPAELHVLTGGNPFFVTEVLASDGLALPPSVGFAVTARLAQLPEPTRELLRVISLVPARVDTDVLDRLAPAWPDVLEPAELAGMVELRGTTLAFRHELARHAVAETMSSLQARRHHAGILAVLTEVGADAASLVHHAAGAGDLEAAARHARVAAAAAHRAQSHREAVAHYERALSRAEVLDDEVALELWLGLGRASMAADAPEETAVDAAARAVDLARAAGDPVVLGRTLSSMSRITSWAGDNLQADALAAEAVEVLSPHPVSAELADAMATAAYIGLALWDFAAADTWARKALDVATAVGDEQTVALARMYLGVVRIAADGDQELFEGGLQAAREADSPLGAIEGYMTAATALAFRRAHADALAMVDRGTAFAHDFEYRSWGFYLQVLRAQVLFETGHWDLATEELRWISADMRLHGWPSVSGLILAGRMAARRGDPEAADLLRRGWAEARRFGVIQLRYPAAAAMAEHAWLEDRLDEVPESLAEVRDDVIAGHWPAVLGEVGLWLHRAGEDPGDTTAMTRPHRLLIAGDVEAAAAAWDRRGCVYEGAEARVLADDPDVVLAGLAVLDDLGAEPLARRARARLRAMGRVAPRGPQRTTRDHPAGLTERQAEVLELVVDGATNAQIADRLVVSVRTVDHHVSAVLQKLGVTSRREAASAAARLREQEGGHTPGPVTRPG